jgi:hypothetical protein
MGRTGSLDTGRALMCDGCDICRELDAIKVRDVTWCPDCGQREVGEGLVRCVMCEATKPSP